MKRSFRANMILWTILLFFYSTLFNGAFCAIKDAKLPLTVGKPGIKLSNKLFKPAQIKISSKYGRVTDSYDAGGNKLIVHIQDAHTNYSAQKNSARIIEYLINNYGLYLILVEGGSRDVSLHRYRERAPLETRKKIAEDALKEGIISGEEYLNVASDYPMKLQGIEDRSLYDQNMMAYLEVDKFKNEALHLARLMESVVSRLKYKIYNRKLLEFDRRKREFKSEKSSLSDYITYLSNLARKRKVDLSGYRNFKNLYGSIKLEKDIDFSAVEKERAEVIELLSRRFRDEKEKMDDLINKSMDFKKGKLTQVQYHNYLREIMRGAGIKLKKYKNLSNYFTYLNFYARVDSVGVLKELKAIEKILQGSLVRNENQRRLITLSNNLDLLIEFIELKLSPDDFDYYVSHEGEFNLASWGRFLNAQAARFNLTQRIPERYEVIERIIPSVKKFYEIARKRDNIFLKNTIKYMDAEQVTLAVLIAGGFHTPTLTELFKKNGISYIVVSPKVTTPTDEEVYRKILIEGWSPTEEGSKLRGLEGLE